MRIDHFHFFSNLFICNLANSFRIQFISFFDKATAKQPSITTRVFSLHSKMIGKTGPAISSRLSDVDNILLTRVIDGHLSGEPVMSSSLWSSQPVVLFAVRRPG